MSIGGRLLVVLLSLCLAPTLAHAFDGDRATVFVKAAHPILDDQDARDLALDISGVHPAIRFVYAKRVFRSRSTQDRERAKTTLGLHNWLELHLEPGVDPLFVVSLARQHAGVSRALIAPACALPDVDEGWTAESPSAGIDVPEQSAGQEVIPNDPRFPWQWHHENTGSNPGVEPPGTPGADIDTPESWSSTTGAVVVAGIDTGFQWYHEDLWESTWQNLGEDHDGDGRVLEWSTAQQRYVFDPGDLNGADDDNNGFIDDLIGWDFEENDNTPLGEGEHGTFTAGSISGRGNNGVGITGVCWECPVVAVRGLCDPGALEYAVDAGAEVIYMSCLTSLSPIMEDALAYAASQDVAILAASGNFQFQPPNSLCESPYVVCVAATNQFDEIWSSSSTGNLVDLGAPGVSIMTTKFGGYRFIGGTSLACPLVAGVGALVRTIAPNLNSREVASLLQTATDPFVAPTVFAGTGRINSSTAVALAMNAESVGSFPVAQFDPASFTVGVDSISLAGIVSSPALEEWSLWVGSDLYPTEFSQLTQSTEALDGPMITLAWDDLPSPVFHLELRVVDSHGQESRDGAAFSQSIDEESGWPVALGAGSSSAPAIADVDGDGAVELVFADESGAVHVLDPQGNPLDGWPQTLSQVLTSAPTLGDVDGDGRLEVFLAPDETSFWAFDHDGAPLTGWPPGFAADPLWNPIIADIVPGGQPEILYASGAPFQPNLHLYNPDGSYADGLWPVRTQGTLLCPAAVGDLDGDGECEIVVASGHTGETHRLEVYSNSGALQWSAELSDQSFSAPSLAEVDGDGTLEILVANDAGAIYLFDGDGGLEPGWPRHASDRVRASCVFGDVDGDGELEIVAGAMDGTAYVYRANGDIVFGWPTGSIPGQFPTSPLLVDTDGEGTVEILFLSHNGMLYSFGPGGSARAGYPVSIGEDVGAHPACGDIDSDGRVEIVIVSSSGNVHILELPSFAPPQFEWAMYRGDHERTGAYSGPTPVEVPSDDSGIVLPRFSFAPNPMNGVGEISFSLERDADVEIALFDINGRRIATPLHAWRPAGDHIAQVGDDGIASGVYFVRIRIDGEPEGRLRIHRVR